MDSVNMGVEDLDATPIVEIKTGGPMYGPYIIPPVTVGGPPPYMHGSASPYVAPTSPRIEPRPGPATFLRQPESLQGIMNQWMAWDAKEQQMLRQNCGVDATTRGVYTPPVVFAPKQLPQLAPIADPRGLQAQIQQIEGKFNGVIFTDEELAARKAFLGRVEKQAQDCMAVAARKCQIWHRQAVEYRSLSEYDAEIMRLRAELKIALAMSGGKRGGSRKKRKGGCKTDEDVDEDYEDDQPRKQKTRSMVVDS